MHAWCTVPSVTHTSAYQPTCRVSTSAMAHHVCRAFFVPGATAESWNLTTPALRVLVRTDWVNRGPPNGSGWYPSIVAAPRYGTHRRPRPSMPQPFIPPPLMPQQHMPWQQLPQHLPPHPMNQQHAAQQQGPKMYQQQMPQQRLLQQHVAQQHVTQQGFQPQHSVSAQRPLASLLMRCSNNSPQTWCHHHLLK